MNKLQKYLDANIWLVFAIIAMFYGIALTIEYKFIFTEDYFVNALGRKESVLLQNFLDITQSQFWINYLLIIPVVWFPALAIGLCLKAGAILRNMQVSYSKLAGLALKSHLIFAVNYLVFTILKWKQIIHREYFNLDNCFDYQSILAIIPVEKIPYWLLYPLQLISICELLQLIIISYGISKLFQYSLVKAIVFYLIFYGVGLFFWVIFSIYLRTFL
ncbi:MAG: hypothetical protein LBV41_13860 [Cytophagaceae bacterium]|jgi:hypothetical protein|nr:hypothetical protein [Cytophagaceae bacterium]